MGHLLYAPSAMDWLTRAISWIAENEAALSGVAALIVVGGVVFTPLGAGVRRILAKSRSVPVAGAEQRGGATLQPAPESDASSPESTAADSNGAPGTVRPSIAVLPFDNLSNDEEQEFLADGMTEDIITGLSANRSLDVVSRNSTFAYKGESPDIRRVGRELGVRYVLEGSVRRVGDRLRTTAQLIEADAGAHLWAEKYDRPYASIFDVQDEVIDSITGALSAQLSQAEYQRASRVHPADLGAWELVQRALCGLFIDSPDSGTCASALELLRAAVERDPDYSYARAALAWILFTAAINGYADDPGGAFVEADRHLKRALEGGTEDPLTLFYAGAAYVYSGRHEQGVRTLERSLLRNPHQPDVYMHLGAARGFLGQFEQAHLDFDRAEALAPTGGMSGAYGWYRSFVLGFEGRLEEAIDLIRSQVEKAPRYGSARVLLGLDLALLGRTEEGRACIERASREDPGLHIDGLALLMGAHPDPEKGAERVALLREYWPTRD